MAKYKIEIAPGCISCGNCQATCPAIFEVHDKAEVKTPEVDDIKCAKQAAETCPVSVIHIKDTKNKKIVI